MPNNIRITLHKQTLKKNYFDWRKNIKYLSKERYKDIYSFAAIESKKTNSNDEAKNKLINK